MSTYALGRKVRHDPRSLSYKIHATATPKTVIWGRTVAPFDQGDLGSCTGNAAVGVLASHPLIGTYPAEDIALTETGAVEVYSLAEKVDGGVGYPPEDEGSSGLSVAQVLKTLGLISGYQHITSVSAAMTAIQAGPFIVGTNWYENMFDPSSSGVVTLGGKLEGGHEYECLGYDNEHGMWHFANSWGTSWGDAGYFYYTTDTFTKLLAADGDATTFVPLTKPAPVPDPPTPTPSPTPSPQPSSYDLAAMDDWASAPHVFRKSTAAAKAWPRVKPFLNLG